MGDMADEALAQEEWPDFGDDFEPPRPPGGPRWWRRLRAWWRERGRKADEELVRLGMEVAEDDRRTGSGPWS